MPSIKDEYREVLENWNDHTLPYDEQLEKALDQLLAINKRRKPKKRYPIGIIVGEQDNKASFNQGYNKALDVVEKELTV